MVNYWVWEFHIKELKYRFFYLVISWLILFVFSFFFADNILSLITNFLPFSLDFSDKFSRYFVFTEISEAFSSFFLISFYWSFFFILPLVLSHFYIFLKPGLFLNEFLSLRFFIFLFYFLVFIAHLFVYFFFLPLVFSFFVHFESHFYENNFDLRYLARVLPLINFCIGFFLQFSFIFQFPLFLFLLWKWKFFSLKFLVEQRRIFLIVALFFGAILSPPDIGSQLLVVFPWFVFFEFLLFLLFWKSLL